MHNCSRLIGLTGRITLLHSDERRNVGGGNGSLLPTEVLILVFGTMRQLFFLASSLVLTLSTLPTIRGDEPSSDDPTDSLFPAEVEIWKDVEEQLAMGIVKAEALRERLMEPSVTHKTGAAAIADLIGEFQKVTQPTDGLAPPLRQDVQAFDVSGDRLLVQIRGDTSIATKVFDAFDGRWFGRWDQSNVNHDWRSSLCFSPPKVIVKGESPIQSLQYAWISNGFGWNYLSARDGDTEQNYVLGMVYYFAHPNYRDITEEKPHVGFADGPTRLIWITEFELYLEEAFPESLTGEPDHYVITGLRHDLLGKSPSVSPKAVQATYTRDPNTRPSFQQIIWKQD